ncbi:MAG: RHS repeat-associated core domain-containing protein, partial [Verrucomicrobia bacterium]|nr:RHS repeat-associated core domain-containing protein [Verrucomicrobiota bacterium]
GVEYGPYGEVVRSTGDLTLLPFRFQTKWALGQSWQGSLALEHLDFGRRVYVPTFGRFLNRDPIGEEGGANLYHYCGNDPINGIDPLGMEEQVNQPKKKPKDPRPPAGPQTGTRLPVTADEAGLTVRTLSPEALYGPGTGGSPGSGSYGVVLEFEGMPESPPPVVKREGNHSWLEPVIITGIRVILIWIPAHDPSLTISSSRGESPRNSRTARDQVSREETQSTQPQRGIPQTTGEQLFQGMRDTLAPAAPGAKLLESAVSFWATAWLTGPLLGVAAKGGPSLVHLTDNAGLAGINQSGAIVGKHGIFAVPRYVTAESTAMKVVRTGLSPLKTSEFVPIPQAAQGLFRQPMPIGPYSAWKYFGGVRYAPAGAISTATGAFTSAGSLLGPGTLIYGPDVLFYGGTCAAAWLCLEEGGNQ